MTTTDTESLKGAPTLAILHAFCGALLIVIGIVRLYALTTGENQRASSPFVNFPWATIGMLHLGLAWTLWKASKWYWVPHLLLLVMWVAGPILAVVLTPHRSGPPPGMVGPGPAIAILVLSVIVVIPVLFLFLEWAYLAWSSDWVMTEESDLRFSLRQFLCVCTLVPALIGIDLLAPIQVKRNKSRVAREKQQRIDEIAKLTDDLAQGALSNDSDLIDQAQQKLIQNWTSRYYESEAALIKMLKDPDVLVRREGLHLIERITRDRNRDESSRYISDPSWYAVLAIVQDPNEVLELRELAVLLMARSDHDGLLYGTLNKMGPNGHFSIPTLANFLADHQEEHWRERHGTKYMGDVLGLLASWKSASAPAVPALIDIVENHPNKLFFQRDAVKTLGAIGSKAQAAVPALEAEMNAADIHSKALFRNAISDIEDVISVSPEQEAVDGQQAAEKSKNAISNQ